MENIYQSVTLSLYPSINPGQITAARVDSWATLSLVLDVSWKYSSTPRKKRPLKPKFSDVLTGN